MPQDTHPSKSLDRHIKAKVFAGWCAKTSPASPALWPLKVETQACFLPRGLPWDILGNTQFISSVSIAGEGRGLIE